MTGALPVIDVSPLLRGGDGAARRDVAPVLGRACREVGFFYCVGHGIAPATLRGAFAASRLLFALPDAARRALSMSVVGDNRGYSGLGEERLDLAAAPDRKESFNIGFEMAPDDPALASEPFRGVNAWPDLPGWREEMLDYYDACLRLGIAIHRGFSLDLALPEDFFDRKLDRPLATLRLLRYPRGGLAQDDGPGAVLNTDYGNITLLAVDGVAGLEVRRRDGVWLDAPSVDGAFICNIGDCLQRWSNDTYVSTPHRVRVPAEERYSIAFFLDPNPDAVIVPVVGEPRYGETTGADYLRSRLEPTHVHLTPA